MSHSISAISCASIRCLWLVLLASVNLVSCDFLVVGNVPAEARNDPVRSPNAPELPREFLVTTYAPPSGGALLQVKVDCTGVANCYTDFQAALDVANSSDIIELEAGATFVGNFVLPAKAGSDWIYIRSSDLNSLPPPGTRVSPSDAASMPKIVTNSSTAAISAATAAHHYRLVGLEVTAAQYPVTSLVELSSQSSVIDDLPADIVLDRLYVHGDPTERVYIGVGLHIRRAAIIDSYIEDIHREMLYDAKGIYIARGPGPFKIVNNHVQGSGENIMIGEGIPFISGVIPADIEIRSNHFYKPPSWNPNDPSYGGKFWQVKNIFEIKNGKRILVSGNILENNWIDAQDGYAVLFTPRNTNDEMPWAEVRDVTWTNNMVKNTPSAFNILGTSNNAPTQQTKRILIHNNIIKATDCFFRINTLSDPTVGITITHNTGIHDIVGQSIMTMGSTSPPIPTAVTSLIRDNVFSHGQFGVFGNAIGTGTAAMDTYFTDYVFATNVLFGNNSNTPTLYPAGNFHPQSIGEVEFVDFSGGNYALSASSSYSGSASDGTDVGIDRAQLMLHIECVVDGTCGSD